jgi:hypothetical protein
VSKGPGACTETLSISAYSAYLCWMWKGDRRDSNPRPSEPQSTDTCSQVSLLFQVFRFLSQLEGADERTRTADLISLRVRFSFLYLTRKVA